MCYKETQSNRMPIIGEGIEGLVTKTLHTPHDLEFDWHLKQPCVNICLLNRVSFLQQFEVLGLLKQILTFQN